MRYHDDIRSCRHTRATRPVTWHRLASRPVHMLPPAHDYAAITRAILDGYSLHPRGDHGVVHWARVHENGVRIAQAVGGDQEVVRLFALFHDARRLNEWEDEGHGQRGADLAWSLRGTLVHLDDVRFDLLYEACRLHTIGVRHDHPTVQACWDADRLDLGRVGIVPSPRRLLTEAARALLPWAHERAERGEEPVEVLRGWGVVGE